MERSMKNGIGLLAALGLFAAPMAAWAGQATVVLNVHHAGCVLCGPIVKSTIAHVKGVSGVTVSQADAMADVTATVTYDAAVTSPGAMIKATTDHGYPAEVAKSTKG
ncbi:MAG: mercuric ion binding protein [Bradyrhizobium sp.]|jgi:mercuric ion binding protein